MRFSRMPEMIDESGALPGRSDPLAVPSVQTLTVPMVQVPTVQVQTFAVPTTIAAPIVLQQVVRQRPVRFRTRTVTRSGFGLGLF